MEEEKTGGGGYLGMEGKKTRGVLGYGGGEGREGVRRNGGEEDRRRVKDGTGYWGMEGRVSREGRGSIWAVT